MQTLTKREVVRAPSHLSRLRPGESLTFSDRKGQLTVTRKATRPVTAEAMLAELDKLAPDCPTLDTRVMEDEP